MKTKFILILFSALATLSALAYGLEYLEKIEKDSYVSFLWILLMPGFILYVTVTGDIHGWQPGPIGQFGRVLVTGFGSALFWTTIWYFIARRRIKKD
jgi:hypothetical protein